MTAHRSPAGESRQLGPVVPHDHQAHRPAEHEISWLKTDSAGNPDPFGSFAREIVQVDEIPTERAPTPAGSEKTTTSSRTSSAKPAKFGYLQALRGRLGDGPGDLTRAEFAVLVMLWTYSSADLTEARPGHARLAADLGYTGSSASKTVGRLTRSLERKRYLLVARRGSNVRGNSATSYTLTLPELHDVQG